MPNSLLKRDSNGCPYLFLAPMEGVADRPFRKALASVGGFDEAITEFFSVPRNGHVESLARPYIPDELGSTPLTAQIMGVDPEAMAEMAKALEKRGAPGININCGCPSNTVTGRGAGSGLLQNPERVYSVAKAVIAAVSVPVSIKMRSGYEDTSLFTENILAAEESGIRFLIVHPRTKIEGYGPPADRSLLAKAKSILRIPLVGNGDIICPNSALSVLRETGCDALMIGRGAVMNPFVFQEIRAEFSGKHPAPTEEDLRRFLSTYWQELPSTLSEKGRLGKLKQLVSFLLRSRTNLEKHRNEFLRLRPEDANIFFEIILSQLPTIFFSK